MAERSKEKGQTKKMHTLLKLIGRTGTTGTQPTGAS